MRLLFTLVAFLGMSFSFHPIHVSVCDIELDREQERLEMTMRTFTDDLEIQIREETGNPNLDILNPPAPLTTDKLLSDYMERHLKMTLNGNKESFNYLGHEVEAGSVYCYLVINGVKDVQTIGATNDILLQTFDDQVNLIHVEVDDETHTMMFRKGQVQQQLSFSKN